MPLLLGKRLDDIATLSKSRLLRALDLKEVSFLLDALELLTVDGPCDLLKTTDEGPRHMGFLLEGQARVVHGEQELHVLGVGDHYGERILLRQSVSPLRVLTVGPARIARLSLHRFESLAIKHPRLALDLVRAIAASASDDARALSNQLHALVSERSSDRAVDVRVRVGEEHYSVALGTSLHALFSEVCPQPSRVIAARLDGRPASLETRLSADAVVVPIFEGSDAGDDVLLRSAGLAVLDVLGTLRPSARARVLPEVDGTVVIEVEGGVDDSLLGQVTEECERRLSVPLPFSEELWTLEEARAYCVTRGLREAASLLELRPSATVSLVRCGQTHAPALGPCVMSTHELGPLMVQQHPRGLAVQVERARRSGGRDNARERMAPRYSGAMADEHRSWLEAFGATSVGQLAELAKTGRLGELVLAAEAFHEKALGRIADDIAQRAQRGLRVLRVAGPSSSGKTTFIRRLTVALSLVGLRTVGLSLDDYYVDRERTVRDEHGELDFESPLALDAELLCEQLARLVSGTPTKLARYDFLTGKSLPQGGHELTLREHDLLLVEGLHALEPSMLPESLAQASLGIFIHPATTLPMDHLNTLAPTDLRLLRRMVRDRHSRGYRAAETLARWPSVRRGEEQHVFARLPCADHVFDTALAYEPCVLKILAERCLLEVSRTDPAFVEACRLRELLNPYMALEPGYVPSSSLLREFIGRDPTV